MGRHCSKSQNPNPKIRKFGNSTIQKKGDARASPFLRAAKTFLFFAAFFFPPLAFFAIEDSSLHCWIAGHASHRRTLPPGTAARRLATSLRGLPPDRDPRIRREQQLNLDKNPDKKMGCASSTPKG